MIIHGQNILISPGFRQNLLHRSEIHDHRSNRSKDIRYRFCVKCRFSSEHRGKQEQGYKVCAFSEEGKRQGNLYLTKTGETVDDLILECQRDDRQSEDPDRPERFCGNDRVCCKETDKQDADGTRKDEEQSGVCRSKDKDVLLRTLYAVGLSGSEIVGKNSLSSAGDTAERHGDYEHEALGNGCAGDQKVSALRTAVFLQDRVHGDDHDVIHGDDDKWGKADGEHSADQPPAVTAEGDADRHIFPEQCPQDESAARHLGDDGCDGGTGDTHVETEDEDWIQNDVQHRAEDDGVHAGLCKALTDDKLVHTCGHQGKYGSGQIYRKICVCVGQCDIAGTEIPQHRNADRVDAGHHEDRTYCQHEETVGENPLGGLFIALSHLHAHKRGTADSHEKCDGADHSDYRTADTGPRQRHVAGAGDISDIHAVYDTVKDADKLCQHTGNCDPDDEFFYVVTAEIIFSSHNKTLLYKIRSTEKLYCGIFV